MAEKSLIAWTDHTFNPWMGCHKVSAGCKHCYAETLTSGRMGLDVFGADTSKRQRTKQPWKTIEKLHREAAAAERVERVFVASLADVFEDAPGPNEWRSDVWELMARMPWFDFQVLTKRPENMEAMLPDDWGAGYPNVWLGTSIEDHRVVERARILADVPAIVHFISYEPAIGPVFYDSWDDARYGESPLTGARHGLIGVWQDGTRGGPELDLTGLEWVICGGESGPGHRKLDLDWARMARERCEDEDVAFFFKQDSGHRTEMGIDALGEIVRHYPLAWDRSIGWDIAKTAMDRGALVGDGSSIEADPMAAQRAGA